jgi:hypothetical protein
VRCLTCDALIKLQDNGTRIVIPIHYTPGPMQRAEDLQHGRQRIYEGQF